MVTVILTRLFLQRRQADLGRTTPDSTQQSKHQAKHQAKQQSKHQAKQNHHKNTGKGVTLGSTWTQLSKITRQLWRFLKHCYSYPHEPTLYQRQLEPMLRQYL